jgi:hypothetical protein
MYNKCVKKIPHFKLTVLTVIGKVVLISFQTVLMLVFMLSDPHSTLLANEAGRRQFKPMLIFCVSGKD